MPSDFDMPKSTIKDLKSQINQEPVFGFSSGKYDLNLIKQHSVKLVGDLKDVIVSKKENK